MLFWAISKPGVLFRTCRDERGHAESRATPRNRKISRHTTSRDLTN